MASYRLCPCKSGRFFDNCCGDPDQTAESASVLTYVNKDGIYDPENQYTNIVDAIESIEKNPDLYAGRFNLFDKKAWFIKMTPRWYSESTFLDPKRIKGKYVIEIDFAWLDETCKKIPLLTTPLIFHTAFCGSTLMTQALDGLFNCLPLREPDATSNLLQYLQTSVDTAEEKAHWVDNIMKLMSRRYHRTQTVVIKTNDIANRLMHDFLVWQQPVPMLFMYTPLSEFLAGCIKANNRKLWIRERYQYVRNMAADYLDIPDEFQADENEFGKMAALYWSYNIAIYRKAWEMAPGKIASLDFNTLLAKPKETVIATGKLFQLDILPFIDVDSHMENLFMVYSKNTRVKYSPQQRTTDIKQLLKDNVQQAKDAEEYAKIFLAGDYPFSSLPGALL